VGAIILPVAPLSTEQYLQMIDAGILESAKVELIGSLSQSGEWRLRR